MLYWLKLDEYHIAYHHLVPQLINDGHVLHEMVQYADGKVKIALKDWLYNANNMGW